MHAKAQLCASRGLLIDLKRRAFWHSIPSYFGAAVAVAVGVGIAVGIAVGSVVGNAVGREVGKVGATAVDCGDGSVPCSVRGVPVAPAAGECAGATWPLLPAPAAPLSGGMSELGDELAPGGVTSSATAAGASDVAGAAEGALSKTTA
jgi:hypothetical protein